MADSFPPYFSSMRWASEWNSEDSKLEVRSDWRNCALTTILPARWASMRSPVETVESTRNAAATLMAAMIAKPKRTPAKPQLVAEAPLRLARWLRSSCWRARRPRERRRVAPSSSRTVFQKDGGLGVWTVIVGAGARSG